MKQNSIKLISLFFISTICSSCYTWYEKKIPMDTTHSQQNLSDFLYEAPKITSLNPPTQVIASQGLYSGTVKVNWNDVENATSYRIERAVIRPDSNGNYPEPEEADFIVINKYVYSTTYSDIIISSPASSNPEYNYIYYYRISAENLAKGLESSEFTQISNPNTKACGWLLPPVTGIEAWKGESEDEIQITWNRVPKATSYSIYRGTKAVNKDFQGMELIDIVSGNKNSYINKIQTDDERGKEFYYKISAGLSFGSEAAASVSALGYSSVPGAPISPKPEDIKVTNGLAESANSLEITWGDGNGNGNTICNYSIYRTSSIDSNFVLLAKLPSSTRSYTDKSAKSGIVYHYYVQTLVTDSEGKIQKSSFSKTGPDSETPAMGFILSCPSDVDILDSETPGNVILRWSPALGTDEPFNLNFSYNIYSDSNQNGNYSNLIKSGILPEECNINDGYYEYEVTKKNFYKISTTNENLVESILSKPVAPNPDAPISLIASKTKKFNTMSEYSFNTNNVYPVLITWKKPVTDNPYGYNIYRSTKPDSSFRKLNDELIIAENGEETLSYIDNNETARAGTIYYYKVVSINSLGMGKNETNPFEENARGYGAITRDQWFREYNKTVKKSQSKLTLMHKSNDMDKLGNETINGDLSGTLSYKAAIAGLGAEIAMHYENYSDFYVLNNPAFGKYFVITGNTDTTSNMSANGNMHGIVNCTGMYPGSADYGSLQIKGGAAGGGSYNVETKDLDGNLIFERGPVNWVVGEE